MNFDFSDEQQLIRDQARGLLVRECTPAAVRAVLENSDAHFDRALWDRIVELGWTAMTVPQDCGGLGLGYLELCVIAEELGRALAPVPFASSVYLATETIVRWGSEAQRQAYLPRLAAGNLIGTLAHVEAPGRPAVNLQVTDGTLSGSKLPVPDGAIADIAVVTARDPQGALRLYVAELDQPGVTRDILESIDPSRPQAWIAFEDAAVQPLGDDGAGDAELSELLDRAAVLLAFEQIGGGQAAMDAGLAYTKERYAFGRPVASFQAIKHKFADMFAALELARANAYYGAWALSCDAPDLPLAAATARVSATDAFYLISKENLQAHGGMGFTWEFDCHLYYRRAQLLSSLVGTLPQWKEHVASRLLDVA